MWRTQEPFHKAICATDVFHAVALTAAVVRLCGGRAGLKSLHPSSLGYLPCLGLVLGNQMEGQWCFPVGGLAEQSSTVHADLRTLLALLVIYINSTYLLSINLTNLCQAPSYHLALF